MARAKHNSTRAKATNPGRGLEITLMEYRQVLAMGENAPSDINVLPPSKYNFRNADTWAQRESKATGYTYGVFKLNGKYGAAPIKWLARATADSTLDSWFSKLGITTKSMREKNPTDRQVSALSHKVSAWKLAERIIESGLSPADRDFAIDTYARKQLKLRSADSIAEYKREVLAAMKRRSVNPAEYDELVKELQERPGVDNAYALANWIEQHKHNTVRMVKKGTR